MGLVAVAKTDFRGKFFRLVRVKGRIFNFASFGKPAVVAGARHLYRGAGIASANFRLNTGRGRGQNGTFENYVLVAECHRL